MDKVETAAESILRNASSRAARNIRQHLDQLENGTTVYDQAAAWKLVVAHVLEVFGEFEVKDMFDLLALSNKPVEFEAKLNAILGIEK